MGLQQYSDWCCRCRVRYKAARSATLLPCKCKVQLFAAASPQVPFPELSTSGYRRGDLQNQGVSLRPCFVQLVQHGGCLGNPTNARSRALDRCDPTCAPLCRTRRKLQEVTHKDSWLPCKSKQCNTPPVLAGIIIDINTQRAQGTSAPKVKCTTVQQ
jgi:hypothetical protein